MKKVQCAALPTPIQKLENITKKVNANIYIKRDDMTGLGLGGNKLRKLDYLVADAIENKCNVLLTYGGVQTNHGRLTAAAAAKFNMKSVIVCFGNEPKDESGNLILDKMLNADVRFVQIDLNDNKDKVFERLNTVTENIVKQYEKKGDKVYIIPIGGSNTIGTYGYIECVKEILNQNIQIDYVVTALGSGGTFSGLWLGAKYYKAPFEVIGISVGQRGDNANKDLVKLINETSEKNNLGIECKENDIWVEDKYFGKGYNIPDAKTREIIYYLAQTEGIFVDPCYTAKAFNGMLDLIKIGKIKPNKNILFIHTGGAPALYTTEHLKEIQADVRK